MRSTSERKPWLQKREFGQADRACIGLRTTMCGNSPTGGFRHARFDHQRMVAMARHIVPFVLGIIAPLTLITWLVFR